MFKQVVRDFNWIYLYFGVFSVYSGRHGQNHTEFPPGFRLVCGQEDDAIREHRTGEARGTVRRLCRTVRIPQPAQPNRGHPAVQGHYSVPLKTSLNWFKHDFAIENL